MEQRLRSQYDIKSAPITTTLFPVSCANRSWYNGPVVGHALNGTSRVMLDYVVPRFKSRRAAGERFFNDMSKTEVTVGDASSGAHLVSVANVCTSPNIKSESVYAGGLVALLTPREAVNSHGHQLPMRASVISAGDILRAKAAVSTEVWSKIGTGTAEMWETVAEYRQTLAMFSDPIGRLNSLSSRLLKSAERGVAQRALLKEISDGYLMMRYGISPLIKSLKDIAASLNKGGGYSEVTSRDREVLNAVSVSSGQTVYGGLTGNWQKTVSDSVVLRGMHLDRGHVSYANNLGFDFRGLALLPLQLTSYSFVGDWFVNLSSYVKSTIPAFGWQSLGGCLVVERETLTVYDLTSVANTNGSVVMQSSPSGGRSFIHEKSTTREPLWPATFQAKSNFKFDQALRVADALGLIASRFTKVAGLLGGPKVNNSAFRDRSAYRRWAEQPGVSDR